MKKILLILLSACLFLGACSFEKNAKASTKYTYIYKDVSNAHWAYYQIKHLKDKKILDTIDGVFKPDSAMTRADVAKLLVKANNLNIDNTQLKDIKATDVSTSDKNFKYIKTAVNNAYFQDSTSFRPNSSITLAELSMALVKAFNLKGTYPYTVSGATSGTYKSYISTMLANELVINTEDVKFYQTKKVTRAEVASYVDKVLSKNTLYQKRRTYKAKTTPIKDWDAENGAIKFYTRKANNGYAGTKYNPLINKQMMAVSSAVLNSKYFTSVTYLEDLGENSYSIAYIDNPLGMYNGNFYFQYVFYENMYVEANPLKKNSPKKGMITLHLNPLYVNYNKLKKGTYADDDKKQAFYNSVIGLYGKDKGKLVFNQIYPEYAKYIKDDNGLEDKYLTKYVSNIQIDIFYLHDGMYINFSQK